MKIQYKEHLALNAKNKDMLDRINSIVEEYVAQGYILTLRQLYYQLVSRDVIANKKAEYDKLSVLLTKGRMGGVVDWSAIEDRGRKARLPYWCVDVLDALNDTYRSYRVDRQRGQKNYIEVWIEKEALSNIFSRVTEKYHIKLMVNKGYSSCSAMHDAALRFKERKRQNGILLYFGDHDPSGKDMVRDIDQRLYDFGCNVKVINPALTIEQVHEYDPPENPTKVEDPRATYYIEQYGWSCWELDALEPSVLVDITEKNVLQYLNLERFEEENKREAKDKQELKKLIANYE